MSRLIFVFVLILPMLLALASAQNASAQQWKGEHEIAQAYDLFIDNRGRRFLVDPETGEIVGRVDPNARFTRRDRIRAQRAWRRVMRFEASQRNRDRWLDNRKRNLDRNRRGRYLDEYLDDDLVTGGIRPDDRSGEFEDPAYGGRNFDERGADRMARLPDNPGRIRRAEQVPGISRPNYTAMQMAQLQVFLDRQGFSPGVIDGVWGSNVARAVASWKKSGDHSTDLANIGDLDRQIAGSGGEIFTTYRITGKDLAGPFIASVPSDYSQKAMLAELAYTSVVEMLSERFHMSEAFLRSLNPGVSFNRPGTVIKVVAPGDKITKKVHYLVAEKSARQLRAYDRNGRLVASYPATIGSAATPSPSGIHKIERIALNPEYTYNPAKNFQQGSNDRVLRIPPGPNGPVGSVWIALSKPTYGIHGTPSPEKIGKTSSHGCIRLTNWDAQELASLVREGVKVEFVE